MDTVTILLAPLACQMDWIVSMAITYLRCRIKLIVQCDTRARAEPGKSAAKSE